MSGSGSSHAAAPSRGQAADDATREMPERFSREELEDFAERHGIQSRRADRPHGRKPLRTYPGLMPGPVPGGRRAPPSTDAAAAGTQLGRTVIMERVAGRINTVQVTIRTT